MRLLQVAEQEGNLCCTAAVVDVLPMLKGTQTQLWNQLINQDHEANRTDESSQKRSAQDTIQKAKSCQTCNENNSSSHTRDNSSNLCIHDSVVVTRVTTVHTAPHDLSH